MQINTDYRTVGLERSIYVGVLLENDLRFEIDNVCYKTKHFIKTLAKEY